MDLLSVIRRWHFRQGISIREIKRRTGGESVDGTPDNANA
jgi:hypothetical protein